MIAATIRNAQRTKDSQHFFTCWDFFPDPFANTDSNEPVALSDEELLKKMNILFPEIH